MATTKSSADGRCETGDRARARSPALISSRISVVTRGEGPDIIFVPGVGAHADVWAAIADSLDENFRVHLVRVNGFAGVPAAANADGPVAAPVAEEIARYIQEQKLERPAIIGHSMGGSIGMMLAARHPEVPGQVMVLDIPPGRRLCSTGMITTGQHSSDGRSASRWIHANTGRQSDGARADVPTMTRNDSARTMLLQYARESHRPTLANAMHELIVTDLRPELSRITVPLVVLYVKPVGVPVSAEQFESGMRESYANARTARLMRIDDSNHYIMIDQPGRVVAEIRSLMKSPP